MLALAAALVCAATASVGALSRLHAVAHTANFDLGLLIEAIPSNGNRMIVKRLAEMSVAGCGSPTWEGQLLEAVVEAKDDDWARGAVNEILLDVDAAFAWGRHMPPACARISLLGALLAAALLLARETRLTIEVLDIVALGASGAVISVVAGAQANMIMRSKKKAVDEFVERVLVAWRRGW